MSENETDSTAAEGPPQVEVLDKAPPVDPALREKILADPNVARLAQVLGVPLDEYVNQIGYYINNPGVQPALAMASDEDLRNKLGVEPPSGFDAPRKKTIELPSQGGKAIEVEPEKADPKLVDAVKKGRFPSKG
jgi:hypothetical protein